jgi:outer membrane biosynthesis protein TonB
MRRVLSVYDFFVIATLFLSTYNRADRSETANTAVAARTTQKKNQTASDMNFLRRVFGGKGGEADHSAAAAAPKEEKKKEKKAAPAAAAAAEPKAKEAKQEQKPKKAEKPAVAAAAAAPESPKEKKKDSPKAAAAASSSSSSSSGAVEETLKVDKDLHCYIVGPKGATIKQLQADTGTLLLPTHRCRS